MSRADLQIALQRYLMTVIPRTFWADVGEDLQTTLDMYGSYRASASKGQGGFKRQGCMLESSVIGRGKATKELVGF